jgi:tetratricopeptide (TPR) repeat protein
MKIAHSNKELVSARETLRAKAVEWERDGELELAAETWQKIIKSNPHDGRAYDRLMIIYRKLKDYEKEIKTINTAINSFEKSFREKQPTYSKKIASISKALSKATGLSDKKGNNIYQPNELARWKKRKTSVLKFQKKAKSR